jgi:hypothetical protein
MTRCPLCPFEAANAEEEVAHMEAEHPGVIEERLREMGFAQRPDGSWVDTLTSDDGPIDIVVEIVDDL